MVRLWRPTPALRTWRAIAIAEILKIFLMVKLVHFPVELELLGQCPDGVRD